jgi:hypothetical protein
LPAWPPGLRRPWISTPQRQEAERPDQLSVLA